LACGAHDFERLPRQIALVVDGTTAKAVPEQGVTAMVCSDSSDAFHGRTRQSLATRLASQFIPCPQKGRLTLGLPNGDFIDRNGTEPGPEARVDFHDWTALLRLALQGEDGFVRGYIASRIATADIVATLDLAACNEGAIKPFTRRFFSTSLVRRVEHALRANTRAGSRRNIRAHYDLGNDFFRLWLDSALNYSSALYLRDESLDEAQERKLDRVLELLALQNGERLLEIGCGWGAFAERALRTHDINFTGITLSAEQLAHAKSRLQKEMVKGKCELRLQDYRDLHGCFDKITSIEMVEAVGERYWPQYFHKLRCCLAEGGRAVIQAITIEEDLFDTYRRRPDFIQRYIFPGGMLPTHRIILEHANQVGLKLLHHESFGDSYARTLRAWRSRFTAAADELEKLGFDRRFQKLWEYYFAYCEVGFLRSFTNVGLYAFGA
jgi:cyclopropane-fatty-acyl-phospholipid synthase